MIKVIILEDDREQRQLLSRIVSNRIMINETPFEYNMEVVLNTSNPQDVINFLSENQDSDYIVFLDIDLNSDISGLNVAEYIRDKIALAEIVFVTTHDEMLRETLKRRVEPLDFIYKDTSFKKYKMEIMGAIDEANKRYNRIFSSNKSNEVFTYEAMKGIYKRIPFSDIFYINKIKGKTRKVKLVGVNTQLTFSGELKDLEKKYKFFFRANREYIININNIVEMDSTKRIVYFSKNKNVKCSVSIRQIRKLIKIINA
ncbi:LytR/AlgR family response regulator transcription factor [Limosilactobacillus reuteri]|uniref:LytR/AlgR family response regulator transcription factor n=1 Tax=Limosilactobacillus reuteri TaxID=1598 RepID=UPI00214C28FC|nr:LytTR family DNA-binding domain-containing protein [Limosilactobacillus reuteri]